MLFLQGVTWQQLASSGKSVDRAQAIERSKQAYLDALKLRPQAPAIFNNLGSLYTLAGDETTADDWYRKAVAADDKRRGYYALNYARALEKRDQKEALRYAQMALKASPDNDEVRAYVGALARSAGSGDEFLQFLVDSAYKGHTKVVTSLALQDLTSDVPRPEAGKSHVLAVLAFALTRDRTALAQQPAPQLIDDLKRVVDTDASIGAQQLVRVLSAPPSTASELGWWNRDRVRALDRSRAAVMRELLISLGLQRTQKDPQDGERLLMSAIELGDRGPDPDAFLRLVELYVNQGQTSRLQELMRRYEVELFSEKGEAYQRNDMQLVYRMHLALGMTYAYMNVWSSPSPFQNATFQLENAGRAAERFNEQARRSGKTERLVMPPAAVLKLSEAYATAGQRDRATQLRIDSADALSTARRTADSVEVFRTIQKEDVARLGVASKEKYRALDAANK
jgi:tetratricopeptide (TPR) repeat protein